MLTLHERQSLKEQYIRPHMELMTLLQKARYRIIVPRYMKIEMFKEGDGYLTSSLRVLFFKYASTVAIYKASREDRAI